MDCFRAAENYAAVRDEKAGEVPVGGRTKYGVVITGETAVVSRRRLLA